MKRPAFGEVTGMWERDGSLRDIYILQTNVEDWRAFLAFAANYSCTYSRDGVVGPMPTPETIFSERQNVQLLSIALGACTANSHFFVESEIELDLDPREIKGSDAHDEALSFIEGLARALGKPALLTPENGVRVPFLSFVPAEGRWHVHS